MNTTLKKSAALMVIIAVILPSVVLSSPRIAHAQLSVYDPINWIANHLTSISSASTANSTLLTQIKGYVLDPLAHALAQTILKSITASVVDWINGSNGSGRPSFVQDLAGHLQRLGDTVSLSFIYQFQQSVNSPFANVIASSLRQNYLLQSSLAGFFAANQCTLYQSSSDINGFVGGNFSQGGWGSWFALTTVPQNDPYMLYQLANGQRASLAAYADANRRQDLLQGNGFLSWCGTPQVQVATTLTTNSSTLDLPTGGTAQLSGQTSFNPAALSNAGTCTNSDGTPGSIETPGSVIHDELTKALGSGVDSLVSTHDFDQMVDTILAALITKVVSDTGLIGTSNSYGGAPSFTTQLNNSNSLSNQSTNGGGTVGNTILNQLSTSAANEMDTINTYSSAWQIIGSAATGAQSNLNTLISCYQSHGLPDSAGAGTALSTVVAPVVTQANTAATIASTARTAAQKAQVEISNAVTFDQTTQASSDMAAVLASPPSQADAVSAQNQSHILNQATASPSGSLSVSGGTTVDQMNLITQNAQFALSSCQGATPLQ